MVFEDMHCADDGVLDFVEYLLDWSAQHRIFILTLARPELSERRPGWAARHRGATAMSLEPLGDEAMEDLIDTIATLPLAAKRRIISHAEGVPLYAIETVRALADRGVLVERDGALVLSGELGELDVPPSLISLLGARLDALGSDGARAPQVDVGVRRQLPARGGAGAFGDAGARRPGGPREPRAQAGAHGSGRPALARPRAVPVQPDPAADCRLRDPVKARAEVPPPGGGALPLADLRQRRRGRRRGPGRALPPGVPLRGGRLRRDPAPHRGDRRAASRRPAGRGGRRAPDGRARVPDRDRPRRRRGGAHRPRRGGGGDGVGRRPLRRRHSSCSRMPRRGSRASAASGTALVSRPRSGRRSAASVAPTRR